jgi:hypothetical protein
LAPGGGRVIGNGSKVELTAENGQTIVYRVTPRIECVVTLERSFGCSKPRPAATAGAQIKHHIDAALHILADVDSLATRVAKPANVINLADITVAAE